jgi:hypothetical protein
MDRTRTALKRQSERRNEDYVEGTAEERVGLVWELTKEAASLSGKYDVERRLQRHVTRVIRRQG